MWQWLKCRFGKHLGDNHTVIMEMGAVFHASICRACLKSWVGKFICNVWDEEQTKEVDGVIQLGGTNPLLMKGQYHLIGDEEELHRIAALLQERRRIANAR